MEKVSSFATDIKVVYGVLIFSHLSILFQSLELMLEKARASNDEGLLEVEAFQEALQHYRELPEQW